MSQSSSPANSPACSPKKEDWAVGVEASVPHTEDKIKKTVTVAGQGKVIKAKSKVFVHYTSSDGAAVGTTEQPHVATLGEGSLPEPLERALETMKVGESADVRVVNDSGASTTYHVVLHAAHTVEDVSKDKDGSIIKEKLVEGDEKEYYTADYESEVVCDLTATDSHGKCFLELSNEHVVIGDEKHPPALEEALCKMKKGEEALVKLSAAVSGHQDGPVEYRVKVHTFTRLDTWTVKGAEKAIEAEKRKVCGNELLKAQQPKKALRKYKRGLEFVQSDYGLADEEKAQAKRIKMVLHNNIALVQLQLGSFKDTVESCTKSIEIESGAPNLKAYLRRGAAHSALDNFEQAKADLKHVLSFEAGNTEAMAQLKVIAEKEKAQHIKEARLFGNMFEKMQRMESREHCEKVTQ